jgi:hypothetical protein
MFRRLLIEEWTTIFTLVAFVTALSVYVTVFYRALRMRSAQVEQLAHLPFVDESTVAAKKPAPNCHE